MMNSKNGGGKAFRAPAVSGGSCGSPTGKNIEGYGFGQGSPKFNQIRCAMEDNSIGPAHEGDWLVVGKKYKNRTSASAAKPCGSSTSAATAWGPNAEAGKTTGNSWPQANDTRWPVARANLKKQPSNRDWETAYMDPPPAPPLNNGWRWGSRGGSSGFQPKTEETNLASTIPSEPSVGGYDSEPCIILQQSDDGSDDGELVDDTDDDLSEDYDSDVSQKSHETRKKNKWFKGFFEAFGRLTVEEINEQTRQWHCPACHNGPGAVEWYKGMQPLMTHAKTKGATRVKLHRELAEVLNEELRQRGTSAIPAGEVFGKWKGLREITVDHEIVWPPTVVIMNTLLEKDLNDKWIGMGNQELLEYFNTYAATKARHSYGPLGHRGMSVLIFEAAAMGYLEAERLHNHFKGEGSDRYAWDHSPVLFYPGGRRQLYGYLACKEDMEIFNRHSQGKSRLKFEMKSYEEMVVAPMKQMCEANKQLIRYKTRFVKQTERSKALEETLGAMSQKLRENLVENKFVSFRTTIQHEKNKEEMDYQERLLLEQIEKVHKATEEKERVFEKLLQEERAKAKQFESSSGTIEDQRLRKEEATRFIDDLVKRVEVFEVQRAELIEAHKGKKVNLRCNFLTEEFKLEEEFDAALTHLMNTNSSQIKSMGGIEI